MKKATHRRNKYDQANKYPMAPMAFAMLSLLCGSSMAADGGLEEIVVTAQKQAEILQNVPISIQAFDSKALETGGVTSVSDLRGLVPSVEIKNYPVAAQDLLITMRGIPVSQSNIFNDPPTAVSIDGVYIARNTGLNLSVADLASVEVLKGPQGTLYGRNTIGGAINMNTVRPSTEGFGFTEALTIGNYGKLTSKTSLNIPVTNELAVKIAYTTDKSDGDVKDSNGSGRHWGDQDTTAGRFDLRWKPSSAVTVDYGYDWNKVDYVPNVNQCLNQYSSNPGPRGAPVYGSGNPLVSLAYTYPNQCSTERMDSIPMPKGPNLFMSGNNYVENKGHTLRVEWEASPTLTLRSISAYRELDSTQHQIIVSGNTDVIGGFAVSYPALPVYPVTRLFNAATPVSSVSGLDYGAQSYITKDKYLSQEFNIIGRPSDTFKYTAGIFYFDEKGTNQTTPAEQLTVNSMGSRFAAIPGQGPISLINVGNGAFAKSHNTSWAIFGQFSWIPNILEHKLELTAGLRYTRDTRDASLVNRGTTTYYYVPNGLTATAAAGLVTGATQAIPAGYIRIPGNAIVPASTGSLSFGQSSPSFTLTYRLDDSRMVYGKIVKGYRSGGFNASASSAAMFAQGFAPETLTSTELGFKGEFFNRKLRTNFAMFQSKYNDQQITIDKTYISTSTRDVINAGKSTYTGFELDVTAALTEALRVGFNYAYVDFKYDKIIDQGVDVTNFFHILPPKETASLSADYRFGKVGPGRLDWNVNYGYTSKSSTNGQDIYTISNGKATLLQRLDMSNRTTPGYGLVNTRLAMSGIQMPSLGGGDLTVAVWIKNLTNKSTPTFVIDPGVGTMVGAASPFIRPRTYGLDVIYRY